MECMICVAVSTFAEKLHSVSLEHFHLIVTIYEVQYYNRDYYKVMCVFI
jgi:hypothetical protein